MAEIHALPATIDHAGAARLVAALAQAFADGADLGPRGSHIGVLGLSLRTLVRGLRVELDALGPLLAKGGQPDLTAEPALARLIAAVEGLVTLACPDPGPEAGRPPQPT